jgi:hypothetical protein
LRQSLLLALLHNVINDVGLLWRVFPSNNPAISSPLFAPILRQFLYFASFLRQFCANFRFKFGTENQKWKSNSCL